MEIIRPTTLFLEYVAGVSSGNFTLVDIGCSGGIDPTWRAWGSRLRAFGFDPNLAEIERLTAAESLPGVKYIAAFIDSRPNDAPTAQMRSGTYWERNPWSRLSVVRTLAIRAKEISKATEQEKTMLNQWDKVATSDPSKPIVLAEFLRERQVSDIDFIKIDVDGADFVILRSLEAILSDMRVLGVAIEVNFFGSHSEDTNTFHNIDRFMKGAGFELFDLSTRRYSVAALPAPYAFTVPAQTAFGRILQGDALYLRDAAAPEQNTWAVSLKREKLIKLAGLFSAFGLPDCAADIIIHFRSQMANLINVSRALDILLSDANSKGAPNYSQYMHEFERDAASFYPKRSPLRTSVRALRKKKVSEIIRAVVRRVSRGP